MSRVNDVRSLEIRNLEILLTEFARVEGSTVAMLNLTPSYSVAPGTKVESRADWSFPQVGDFRWNAKGSRLSYSGSITLRSGQFFRASATLNMTDLAVARAVEEIVERLDSCVRSHLCVYCQRRLGMVDRLLKRRSHGEC